MGVVINRTARFGQSDFGAPSPNGEHVSVHRALDPSRRFWRLGEPEPNPTDLWSPVVATRAPTHRLQPAASSTRLARTAATHAGKSVRTYDPRRLPSSPRPARFRVSSEARGAIFAPPWIVRGKARAPVRPRYTPAVRVSGTSVDSGLAPRLSAYGKDAYDSTSASHFLRYEHPRLVGSGSPSCDVATQGPGFSRSRAHFGGSIVLAAGVVFPSFTDRPSL